MAEAGKLFGRSIVPHHLLNFSEQIYDILVSEIETGRWKINDRMPGVMSLARELGVGTKTVQTAYDRLKSEGYVTSLGYRGTYLQSTHPRADRPDARIGVLLPAHLVDDPLILWYEHIILQVCQRKNLVAEMKTVPPGYPAGDVHRAGTVFDSGVSGILSLMPFRMPVRFGDEPGLLPVVFLVPPYESCEPKVCADVREAYFDLTSRAIRYGYSRVVFSEDSFEPDPRQSLLHREGYEEAMSLHGREPDQAFIDASRTVNNNDTADMHRHVRDLLATATTRRPPAVIAGSLGRAMAIARASSELGIAIPSRLALGTIGTAPLPGPGHHQITGMDPDFELMVETCLQMLGDQTRDGRAQLSQVHVRMHPIEGRTLPPFANHRTKAKPSRQFT